MTDLRTVCALQAAPSPEQVAQLLHGEAGFTWLDGGASRHFIFRNPTSTVSSDDSVNSLDVLDRALAASPDHALCAGYIGYEVAADLENVLAGVERSGLPRLYCGIYGSALIADEQGRWFTTAPAESVPREEALLEAAARVDLPPIDFREALSPGPLTSSGDLEFGNGVRNIVARIHRGDLFETNLCRRLEAPLKPTFAWPLYRRMRALNPASYGAFLQLGEGRTILSGSPELFLKVEGQTIESRPIKGTRPRSACAGEDFEMRAELAASSKDRAELAMVVDVTRNDLSRVCEPGSVLVTEHASLLTLPTLHHTYSRVTGRLSQTSPAEILRATFPPASITGAPKLCAIDTAFEEERRSRGPSMGAIGWFSRQGQLEMSVAIRTAWASEGRVTYLAGCGITAESVPDRELEESRAKASAFLAALGFAGEQI